MIKFYKYNMIFILLIIFSVVKADAENLSFPGAPGSVQELTLNEFIRISCEQNPEFRKIIMDRLYLEYEDDISLDPGELIADVESGYYYSMDTDKRGFEGGISVGKLFPKTATDVSASYSTSPGITERSSSLSFRISQEIAENSFGKKWKIQKEQLDFKKELVLYQIAETYEDYLYYLVTLYYNWLSAFRELESAERSFSESKKLFENITLRKKNSIADQEDVNRSELQLLSKIEGVKNAENTYKKVTAGVYNASGIPSESQFYPADSDSGFSGAGADEIKNESRTYAILELYEKIGMKEIEIGKNSLLPGISLFSEFSVSGNDFSFTGEPERSLSFGISLNDIGKTRKEKAEIKSAEIDLEKKKLENLITKNDLDLTLVNYSEDIGNVRELAELYRRKTVLSEKILDDVRKKYSIGKEDLSSLIDAINSVDLNRRKKLDYEAELNILIAGWLNLTDSLIRENRESGPGYEPSFKK